MPFQRRVGVLFRRLTVVAIVAAAALFAVSFANGESWSNAGLAAVTFAIALAPAGFPIVLARSLFAIARRLVPRGVVIRRFAALETLGSVTAISVDHTAMLTRPEAASAVEQCSRAGVRVIILTADDELVASAAAEAANVPHGEASIITGDELESLLEEERESRIRRTAIFARMSATQKFLVIDGLQRTGAVVAMIGDGGDDGPALRRADVGIVGRRGTDATRGAADVVLLDDDVVAIVDAIGSARHALQSGQRALLYLVAFHLPVVVLTIVAPLAGVPLAVLPINLLWLELLALWVTASVFLAEAPIRSVMTSRPRNPRAPLVPGPALLRSVTSGGLVAFGAWATYAWRLPQAGEAEARAMALIVLLGGNQALMLAECLALPRLGVRLIPRTRRFWLVWFASAMSLGVVLYVPAIAGLFGVEPPAPMQTLAALTLGVLGVAWRLVAPPPQSMPPVARAR